MAAWRLVLLLAVAAALANAAQAADLSLQRVMLSSAGVGYFEFAAEVDGAATLGLDVPLDQVDDVLMSLVVFDDAGGVGGIELPGRDQTHAAFGDVPFGPDALASPLAFLNSLQGVGVTVLGPRPMGGRILQAETVHETGAGKDAPGQDRTRVSVLTPDGLRQFVLEDSDSVQITDPDLRGRVDRALAALRQESGQDRRHIGIRTAGVGHRTVRVGYVAVAPLWKASYRMLLPPPDADPAGAMARMQGWATLENASGVDWSDVALTLQWGNPVTFHQAIYRSYFVARPEVPVEVLGRLLPDVDTRALKEAPEPAEMAAPAPVPAPRAAPEKPGTLTDGFARSMAPPADTAAASEGYETVFALATPISLAAGHSASVPILDRALPATRVSLARAQHAVPIAAVRIRNVAADSLPAGVLTLYDPQAAAPFVGDARLGGLPAGETRLLSYAQDLRTGLQWRTASATTIASIKAASGTLTLDERIRQTMRVTLAAPQTEPRRVLLEVPKSPGGVVAKDAVQPAEETAAAWRFAVDLRPGEVREVTLAIDQPRSQVFSLLRYDAAMVTALNLPGASETARKALDAIAALRGQEAARTTERDQLVTQRNAFDKDEERLRANLAAVPVSDALHSRLVQQLGADEARIGQLAAQIDAATQAVAKAHQALADAINSLTL